MEDQLKQRLAQFIDSDPNHLSTTTSLLRHCRTALEEQERVINLAASKLAVQREEVAQLEQQLLSRDAECAAMRGTLVAADQHVNILREQLQKAEEEPVFIDV